jgi:hypothetical protein
MIAAKGTIAQLADSEMLSRRSHRLVVKKGADAATKHFEAIAK